MVSGREPPPPPSRWAEEGCRQPQGWVSIAKRNSIKGTANTQKNLVSSARKWFIWRGIVTRSQSALTPLAKCSHPDGCWTKAAELGYADCIAAAQSPAEEPSPVPGCFTTSRGVFLFGMYWCFEFTTDSRFGRSGCKKRCSVEARFQVLPAALLSSHRDVPRSCSHCRGKQWKTTQKIHNETGFNVLSGKGCNVKLGDCTKLTHSSVWGMNGGSLHFTDRILWLQQYPVALNAISFPFPDTAAIVARTWQAVLSPGSAPCSAPDVALVSWPRTSRMRKPLGSSSEDFAVLDVHCRVLCTFLQHH